MKIEQIDDIQVMMSWRREVLREVFGELPSEKILEENRHYFATNDYVACVAVTSEGDPAGCGAFCLQREMPSPDNPNGRCAYLMNIYVRPRFRNQGVGREIVSWLKDEAKKRNCKKIYLETTPQGRKLYEECGFVDLNNMMIL